MHPKIVYAEFLDCSARAVVKREGCYYCVCAHKFLPSPLFLSLNLRVTKKEKVKLMMEETRKVFLPSLVVCGCNPNIVYAEFINCLSTPFAKHERLLSRANK